MVITLERVLEEELDVEKGLQETLREVRERGLFSDLSGVVIDATDTNSWDIFKKFQKHALHLGAVSVATLLKSAGFKDSKAVYEILEPDFDYSGVAADVIGISSIISNVPYANEKIKLLRATHPNALIIAGGAGYFFDPDVALLNGADMVVIGKAEFALVDFLKEVQSQRIDGESLLQSFWRAKPNDIQGVYTGDNERTVARVPLMDEIPRIDYSLVEGKQSKFMRTVLSSFGCTVRDCDFCSAHILNSGRYRFGSTERVVADVVKADEDGIGNVFVADDHMFGRGIKKIEELSIAFAKKRKEGMKVGISAQATVDSIYQMIKAGTAHLLRKAGFSTFYLGVESVHDDEIDKMNASKKTSRKKLSDVLNWLCRAEIDAHAMCVISPIVGEEHSEKIPYSIPNNPGAIADYKVRMREAVDFLREHGVRSAQFHLAVPLPGAGMTKPLHDAGVVLKTVGGVPVNQSFYTGQYAVASANPLESDNIMRDTYKHFYRGMDAASSFWQAASIFVRGAKFKKVKRRVWNGFLKMASRRIMKSHLGSEEVKRYRSALEEGNYQFYRPGEAGFSNVVLQ
jgi:radical SAM superfamily enzyme YgiQ (UPF0313 family)